MVKKKTYVLACAALAMMVALSACSSAADQPKNESEQVNSEASSGTADPVVTENTNETDTETVSTPAASEASTDPGQTVAAEDMPENLPKDFLYQKTPRLRQLLLQRVMARNP